MVLLFRPVDTTYLMRENPNDRDIPETLVCLKLQNSVVRGRDLSGARLRPAPVAHNTYRDQSVEFSQHSVGNSRWGSAPK
jgi:hypothetical protein